MVDTMTLEQMAALVARLPPPDQLRLVAQISGQLSTILDDVIRSEGHSLRKERLRLAEELLAEVEDTEDDSQGEFDAAETVQQLRDERTAQICPKRA